MLDKRCLGDMHLLTCTFMCVHSHVHEPVHTSAAKTKLFYFCCFFFFLIKFSAIKKNTPKGFCLGDCPAFHL